MKTQFHFLTFALSVAASLAQAGNTDAVNDILKLKGSGFNDDAIVSFIKGKNINYDLSADDVIALSKQGVAPAVLNAMMSNGTTAVEALTAAPQPVAATQPVADAVFQSQAMPVVTQPALPPDAAYFYQELSPYGRWILAEDNQWYWQPTVLVNNPTWRPYLDNGHWVNTDHGWYWSSDYAWGWAAFHYGRWQLHPHHGWMWFPDQVWGPAWVAWRSGGNYCGWAPLPPGAVYDSANATFIFRGKRVGVEFDFGLDFNHFSFCLSSDMGRPTPSHFRPEESRDIFSRTTPATRYEAVPVKGEARSRVVNRGFEAEPGRPTPSSVRIQDIRTPVGVGRAQERLDPKAGTIDVYRPKMGGHDEGQSKKSWWFK